MIDRAVALNVITCKAGETVRFDVFHQDSCLATFSHERDLCNCRPVIFWREVCDPVGQMNILVDKARTIYNN